MDGGKTFSIEERKKMAAMEPGMYSDPSGRLYMTEEAIMEILARERRPVPWWLIKPEMAKYAALYEEHEDRRMERKAEVRKEYESNGSVRLPDDYFEKREQAQAICDAALFATDDDNDDQPPADPEQ